MLYYCNNTILLYRVTPFMIYVLITLAFFFNKENY